MKGQIKYIDTDTTNERQKLQQIALEIGKNSPDYIPDPTLIRPCLPTFRYNWGIQHYLFAKLTKLGEKP